METRNPRKRFCQRGQSLVEVALLLPILLVIIAGLVEVSNLIIAQSRSDTAARSAARFGASGGEPAGMRITALNALTQTLDLDQELWDMWVFNGTVNDQGTAFIESSWSWEHIYGLGQTSSFANVNEIRIQQDVLTNLRSQSDQNSANVQIVGIIMYHDLETILGLDVLIEGLSSVRGFAVMEVPPIATAKQTEGCSGFPIMVEYGQRSVNTVSYNAVTDWEYPTLADRPELSTFTGHSVDVPLDRATEGSIFRFTAPGNYPIAGATTNFDWLAWNTVDPDLTTDLEELQNSLAWPGNSVSPIESTAYVDPVTFIRDGLHGLNPANPDSYDLVSKAPVNGNSSTVGTIFQEHIDRDRNLRILVWERDLLGGGADPGNLAYKVRGFVVGKIVGYQLNPSSSTHWLMIEVIRWEDDCGVTVSGPGS